MSRKTMVVDYQFDDPTLNVTMVGPSENERAFLARLLDGNDSAVTAVTGLGLTNVKISFEDWTIGHLFDGGTSPEDPIRPRNNQ